MRPEATESVAGQSQKSYHALRCLSISGLTPIMAYSTDVPLLSKLCCQTASDSDWHAFYANYRGLIAKWCSQKEIAATEFDDIFHDVLIKLVDALPNYQRDKDTRFRSWLKTVVMNALIDRVRLLKNHPFPKLISDSEMDAVKSADTLTELGLNSLAEQLTDQSTSAAEILAKVEKRVKSFTWDSFVRRELLLEEVESIASELGIKKASVYQSCSRVRALIKEESENYFRGI
ncbi:MAG: sigma-70 family RNA polymerase sigma factor [Planctomycetota bacterium]